MRSTVATLRVVWRSWVAAATAALQYRIDFAVETVLNAIWLAVPVAPILLASAQVGDINGWNRGELLVVQAAWYVLDGIVWMVLLPNMGDLSAQVTSGELDMILLRPVDSMVYASTRRISTTELGKFPLAFGLFWYGLATSGAAITATSLLAGMVGLLAAVVLFWSLSIVLNCKALTAVRFDAGWIAVGAHNIARVPVSFFGRTLSLVMATAVPIALLTSVPSELALGRAGWRWVAYAAVAATAMVTVARVSWRSQVRQYSGAMS